MNPLNREAESILDSVNIETRLAEFEFYLTGSVELDVMAWPDIDINVLYKKEKRESIYDVASSCLNLSPTWFELRCTEDEEESPGHFFLGFEFFRNDILWNFDIWFLNQVEYNTGLNWINSMNHKLDPAARESIVDLKHFLIEKKAYPNIITSMEVYNAVLNDRVSTLESFQSWYENQRIT